MTDAPSGFGVAGGPEDSPWSVANTDSPTGSHGRAETMDAQGSEIRGTQDRLVLDEPRMSYPTFTTVKDHGAKGDGTTDDATAINAALSACPAGFSVSLNPTSTGYAIGSTIVIPAGVRLTQANGGADSFGLIVKPGSNLDAMVADNGWYNNLTSAGSTYFSTVQGLTLNPHDTSRTSLTISALTTSTTAPQITAAAHGLSANQGICIRGVPGLNGGYTVATVVDANNITIAANYPQTYSGSGGTLCHGQGHGIVMSSFHTQILNNTINGVTDGDGVRVTLTTRNGSAISGSINEWRIVGNHIYMAGDATGNYSGGSGIATIGSNITDGFVRDNVVSGAAGAWAVTLNQGGGTQVTGNHIYHYQQSCMRVANIGNGSVQNNYLEGWLPTQVANMGEIDILLVTVNAPGAIITGNKIWVTGNGASGNTYYGIHVNSGTSVIRASAVVANNSCRNDCTTATGIAIYYDDSNVQGLDITTGENAVDLGPSAGGWATAYESSAVSTHSINKFVSPWQRDSGVVPSRVAGSGGLFTPLFTAIANGGAMPASPNSFTSYALAIPIDFPQVISVSGINFHLSNSGAQGASGNSFLSVATALDDGTGTSPASFKTVLQQTQNIDPTQATGEIAVAFSGAYKYQAKRYWLVLAFQLGAAGVAMTTMPSVNTYSMVNQIGVGTLATTTTSYAWLYTASATASLGQVNAGGGVRYAYCPALACKVT